MGKMSPKPTNPDVDHNIYDFPLYHKLQEVGNGSYVPQTEIESKESVRLQKTLGLRNGIAIIVGIIIGSGIFVSPKGVLIETGSVGMSLVVWGLCGFIALFGALCYGELGTSIPISGGAYSYINATFGELPAFLILWCTVIIRTPTGNAVVALTFANYVLQPIFPHCEPPEAVIHLLAAISICLLSFLNCVSVKWSTRVQDFFSFMKITALCLIIMAGLVKLGRGETGNFEEPFKDTEIDPGKLALAFYSGLFSFSGWDSFNYVTEEIKNPSRNLPLAIWISVPLVTVTYVLTNVAYFTVLTPEDILESNAVAVTFGDKIFGVMAWAVPFFVAFSCFGSLNGCILTGSRMFFVGAREGHLPDIIALVNRNYYTPITSVIFTCIMSLVMLCSSDIYKLISYFAFVEALMLGAPVVGLLYLRWKCPNLPRPVKVNLAVPILFLIVTAFLLIFPWFTAPLETLWGLIMVLSGIPVYFFGVSWKQKPKMVNVFIRAMTIGCQKLLNSVKEDKYEETL